MSGLGQLIGIWKGTNVIKTISYKSNLFMKLLLFYFKIA